MVCQKNIYFYLISGMEFAKVVEIWSQSHVKLEDVLLRFGLNCNGITTQMVCQKEIKINKVLA